MTSRELTLPRAEAHLESDKSEGKVDHSDRTSHRRGVLEPQSGEDGSRVVHERVEAAQLLRSLQTTANNCR